ncbi:MAG: NUDIX domain-containing protein [Gammaproteobacteria bacterium]
MLDSNTFKAIVAAAPLVSVDLVVVRGAQEVLLGLRNNRPAQGFWFVPGGRILKNEPIQSALARIAETELGLGAALAAGEIVPHCLGVFEHFYSDCFAGDVGISTHYVVLGHIAHVPMDCPLPVFDEQHSQLRWWPIAEALASPVVHRFTKDYILMRDAL